MLVDIMVTKKLKLRTLDLDTRYVLMTLIYTILYLKIVYNK